LLLLLLGAGRQASSGFCGAVVVVRRLAMVDAEEGRRSERAMKMILDVVLHCHCRRMPRCIF
jgi:hypothetical protein